MSTIKRKQSTITKQQNSLKTQIYLNIILKLLNAITKTKGTKAWKYGKRSKTLSENLNR